MSRISRNISVPAICLYNFVNQQLIPSELLKKEAKHFYENDSVNCSRVV